MIPVVDVASIGLDAEEPKDQDYKEVGKQLYDAFSRTGFVYVKNHGISKDMADAVFKASDKFFNLDLDLKKKYAKDASFVAIHGYVQENLEHLDVLAESEEKPATYELRESYNVVGTYDPLVFPDDEVPEFRKSFTAVGLKYQQLNIRVLRALSFPLNVEKEFFVKIHGKVNTPDNPSTMRTCYYPPINGAVKPGSIRCGEHADYGTLSYLFQDSMGGLQVQDLNHKWLDATPIEGTMLINVGDLFELYTNGRFPATVHRVIIPEEEIKRKEARHSLIFFTGPNVDEVVHVLNDEKPKKEKYKPKTVMQHVMDRFATTFS